MVFGVFGRFPLVFGLVSYPPGPILESVFLWRVPVDRNLLGRGRVPEFLSVFVVFGRFPWVPLGAAAHNHPLKGIPK